MINSMTGYGDAEGRLGGTTYTVEIRALNNRYFKAKIKLHDAVGFLEEDIEKLLQKDLGRGMINYTLKLKDASADMLCNVDEGAIRTYVERLKSIASSAGVSCQFDMAGFLIVPGVLTPASPDEDKARQIKDFVLKLTQEAIGKLRQMRSAEGAALEADLNEHCDVIKQDLEKIRQRAAVVLQEYHKKLKKRVDMLLADARLKLDEETLSREVAVFAERCDISEELARMESHIVQFVEAMRSSSQAGRRLDFISQEMLREANTIASKVSDVEITTAVVDMKCCIDRIKEQVQNVE